MNTLRDLLLASFIVYLTASILFFMVSMLEKPKCQRPAEGLFLLAFLIEAIMAVLYSKAAGRLPLASMYEFVLLLSIMLALIFFTAHRIVPKDHLGSVIAPLQAALLVFLITRENHIQPLVPALQSIWLHFHVALAIIAYGLFALSFAAGILCLLRSNPDKDRVRLENLITSGIALGFPFQTLVLITGAVWAEQAWGTWWSWDPKETWALVTWLIYALYLHARNTRGWDGHRAALMAVLGFVTVLFTLFGVTFLLPGLHSYG